MSDEHMNANKYLKGRFINMGNIITDTINNWQFQVEMEQTNEDSCFADTISVLTFLNQLSEENEQLKQKIGNLEHTRDFCADVCADCERLEKENEQLKQELQRMKKAEILANQRGELIGFATSLIDDLGSQEMQEMWTKFREKKYKEWRELD